MQAFATKTLEREINKEASIPRHEKENRCYVKTKNDLEDKCVWGGAKSSGHSAKELWMRHVYAARTQLRIQREGGGPWASQEQDSPTKNKQHKGQEARGSMVHPQDNAINREASEGEHEGPCLPCY